MRLTLLPIALAASVHASDPCCIDEDIAAAFLPQVAYSRTWPGSFPVTIDLPELEFVGSSSHDGQYRSVAWRSPQDIQSARDALAEELVAQGWSPLPEQSSNRARFERGFIPHTPRTTFNNQQFCRDRDGTLTVLARASTIGTIAILSHQTGSRAFDCSKILAERALQPEFTGALMEFLPALVLPPGVDAVRGIGTGGGHEDAHARTIAKSDMSASALASHFESQMTDQQWIIDTRFQGAAGSGHVWTRSVNGLNLVCIVSVFETDGALSLRMHLVPV